MSEMVSQEATQAQQLAAVQKIAVAIYTATVPRLMAKAWDQNDLGDGFTIDYEFFCNQSLEAAAAVARQVMGIPIQVGRPRPARVFEPDQPEGGDS